MCLRIQSQAHDRIILSAEFFARFPYVYILTSAIGGGFGLILGLRTALGLLGFGRLQPNDDYCVSADCFLQLLGQNILHRVWPL